MTTEDISGGVFETVIPASAHAPSEMPSLGVTRTVHDSPFAVSEEGMAVDVWEPCNTLFRYHS